MPLDFNWDDIKKPEDIFDIGKKKMAAMKGKGWGFLPVIIIVLLVIFTASSGFFTIEADEVGVLTFFGKYKRTVDPGLHFKIPLGIEKVYPVKVERVFKEEFGFRTEKAGIKTRYSTRSFLNESLMLTGDLNAVEVEWIVQYNIKDPKKVLFNIKEPKITVRDMSQAVMRQVVGDYSVDEVITVKGQEIESAVKLKLQEILDHYNTGIHIKEVKLQDVNPPEKVKPAFNEVNQAKQEKEKVVNQSWEAYNKIIPRARGLALKGILESEGYYQERVNRAKGDASAFEQVLAEYLKAKDITKKRLYLETMSKVLSNVKKKYIMRENANGVLPLLQIGGVQ